MNEKLFEIEGWRLANILSSLYSKYDAHVQIRSSVIAPDRLLVYMLQNNVWTRIGYIKDDTYVEY